MLWWGVFWGALLAAALADADGLLFGAILGLLAAWWLRWAVRAEVRRTLRQAEQEAVRVQQAALRFATPEHLQQAPQPQPTQPQQAQQPVPPPSPQQEQFEETPPPFPAPALAPAPAPAHESFEPPALPQEAAEDKAWGQPAEFWQRRAGAGSSFVEDALAGLRALAFGGNTLVRVGAVILFIGLSFLLRYAAQRGLLPLPLRLAAVAATGLAMLGVGWRVRQRRPGYALSLQGAGVAVLYLTAFAALRLGVIASAPLAFALMLAACAVGCALALAQNSLALAMLAFGGGFVAPLLLPGGGSHVVLFGYYALLNAGVLALAARRGWRPLALLGCAFSFGVGLLWVAFSFRNADWATATPFVALFLAMYVLLAVLQARPLNDARTPPLDAALVFGAPLAAFAWQAAMVWQFAYGAAWAAAAFGAAYALLALWCGRQAGMNLLARCFAALAAVFVTMAVPLALDARWTAVTWVLEGAAMLWLGVRQGRWLPRAFGVALQLGACAAFVFGLGKQGLPVGAWPLLHSASMGALALAAAALFSSWLLAQGVPNISDEWPDGEAHWLERLSMRCARAWGALEANLPLPLLAWGFALACAAWRLELARRMPGALPDGAPLGAAVPLQAAYATDVLMPLLLAPVFFAAALLALSQKLRWPQAVWPARLALVWMAGHWLMYPHVLAGAAPLVWPLALVAQAWMLHRMDGQAQDEQRRWLPWLHTGTLWLLWVLLSKAVSSLLRRSTLPHDWHNAAWLAMGAAVLVLLTFWVERGKRTAWPLAPHARSYLWAGALPLAAGLALLALTTALVSSGSAKPLALPYVPLLNTGDAPVALAAAALLFWRRAVLRFAPAIEAAPRFLSGRVFWIAAGVAAFIAISTVWLRVAHHWFGVPWRVGDLAESFVVQAGYSILWSLLALALMVTAHRRRLRALWLGGAALLALVTVKLLLVDLANHGGAERIIAFISVGALMLLIGWLAPIPPTVRQNEETDRV